MGTGTWHDSAGKSSAYRIQQTNLATADGFEVAFKHHFDDGTVVGTTIQEQCRQCLRNIAAILKAAGTSLDNVVSATVILLDANDFAGMNEEWIKWFPADPPARQGALLPARIPA